MQEIVESRWLHQLAIFIYVFSYSHCPDSNTNGIAVLGDALGSGNVNGDDIHLELGLP